MVELKVELTRVELNEEGKYEFRGARQSSVFPVKPGFRATWAFRLLISLLLAIALLLSTGCTAKVDTGQAGPALNLSVGTPATPQETVGALQIMLLLTVLALAPALLVLTTGFTRIVIVLSVARNAIGVPQVPPNQVVVGLGLFLTFFVMAPVWNAVNQEALQPYLAGQIDQSTAIERASTPMRDFMLRQTREADLALFVSLAKMERPRTPADVPTYVLVPGFVISELRTAFQMAFVIYIPFLVIDMVVSTTMLSMGMLMLPPTLISLPFKILLFVMVDGWHLLTRSLILSFR